MEDDSLLLIFENNCVVVRGEGTHKSVQVHIGCVHPVGPEAQGGDGRWGGGETGRWGDGEVGRWGGGEGKETGERGVLPSWGVMGL